MAGGGEATGACNEVLWRRYGEIGQIALQILLPPAQAVDPGPSP